MEGKLQKQPTSNGKHWNVKLELLNETLNYKGKGAFPSRWEALCQCIRGFIHKPFG